MKEENLRGAKINVTDPHKKSLSQHSTEHDAKLCGYLFHSNQEAPPKSAGDTP